MAEVSGQTVPIFPASHVLEAGRSGKIAGKIVGDFTLLGIWLKSYCRYLPPPYQWLAHPHKSPEPNGSFKATAFSQGQRVLS